MEIKGEEIVEEESKMINKLKIDKNLYNTFINLCMFSTRRTFENTGFAEALPFRVMDGIKELQENGIKKSTEVLKSYIEILKDYKLIEFVDKNKSDDNIEYNSEIIITGRRLDKVTGVNLYRKIILDEEELDRKKEFNSSLEACINEVIEPYRSKLEEVDKKIDDGIIKNIQVMSIFAGIIALLFTNVLGIKEFNTIGVRGLMYINFSITITIFALIFFIRQLIINTQFNFRSLFRCVLVTVITFLPILILYISIA